jgi:hypothetical protein
MGTPFYTFFFTLTCWAVGACTEKGLDKTTFISYYQNVENCLGQLVPFHDDLQRDHTTHKENHYWWEEL